MRELIVASAGCEHDNTEDLIEFLDMAGELSADRFGTPLTRHTYQGRIFIKPSTSREEAEMIVRNAERHYNAKLKVEYV